MARTLGLPAPVARFLRAIGASALGAGMVALLAQVETLKEIVVDAVQAIPGLSVDSETTVAFVAVAVVLAAVQAADKFFREHEVYKDVVGNDNPSTPER